MTYEQPPLCTYFISPEQNVQASLSRCREGESIDAWGVSRDVGVGDLLCEQILNSLVAEGKAVKCEDNPRYYQPTALLWTAKGLVPPAFLQKGE